MLFGPDEETKKAQQGEPATLNEDILAFVDMHGHSRKKNVFIYGPQEPLHSEKYLKMRIIPKLLAEETAKFRYHSCRFRLEASKLKAARVVMWREFAIMNCFTFEASFHGHFDHENTNYEFTTAAYEEMGEHLANSLFEYLMIMEEEERRRKLKEIAKKKKRKQKQLLLQRAAQIAKDSAPDKTANGVSAAAASNTTASAKDGANALGSYLNLPPSGKSGKKAAQGVAGSSSSRARNVSHVTNKDSDKETAASKKGKKPEPHPKPKDKRKTVLIKSGTSSTMNVSPELPESRNVISSQE